MNQCQHCGKDNAPESKFCRYCGQQIYAMPQAQNDYRVTAPRPYAWKTDELQTNAEARNRSRSTVESYPRGDMAVPHQFAGQPLARHGAQDLTGNYRCPNCGTHYLPVIERRISTAGWITFALLLVFTFIFFWIGLLLKEDVSICPVCKYRLN
ncbi:MAG TPA: LITAF-like zinc ribbon domain-containing protein [Pyrinomonadaceae bacterium]|nr:LITAF-like zinc ribbon domain-containing protein [Pyrinomonadaceae bacterium]